MLGPGIFQTWVQVCDSSSPGQGGRRGISPGLAAVCPLLSSRGWASSRPSWCTHTPPPTSHQSPEVWEVMSTLTLLLKTLHHIRHFSEQPLTDAVLGVSIAVCVTSKPLKKSDWYNNATMQESTYRSQASQPIGGVIAKPLSSPLILICCRRIKKTLNNLNCILVSSVNEPMNAAWDDLDTIWSFSFSNFCLIQWKSNICKKEPIKWRMKKTCFP